MVWTPCGITTQRIYQDFNLTEKLLRKLTTFYVESMLPEIVRRLIQPSEYPSASTALPTLYCICQKEESGRMIMCDSPSCKYIGFHYKCVGIRRACKGTWFCPQCAAEQSDD